MSDTKKHLDYEAIKSAVSISTLLVSHYNLGDTVLTLPNGDLAGQCPICKTSTEQPFRVQKYRGLDYWACFQCCRERGDVLDLVAKIENVDTHKSAFLIATWFDLLPKSFENGTEKSALEGKGYMRDLGRELKKRLAEGDDDETIRFVKAKVLESYRNGQEVEKVKA